MNVGEYSPIGVMVKDTSFSLFGKSKGSRTPILIYIRLQIYMIECILEFYETYL